ncbi:hypothetical protein BGZ93_009802 [Podila epicladia]|nr:hypothetical protein BGZ93_009802 [Podila epicladia]
MQLRFLTTVAAVSLALVSILPSTTARAVAIEKRDLLGGLIPGLPNPPAPSIPPPAPVTSSDIPPAPKPSPPAPVDPPTQPITANPPATTSDAPAPPGTSQPPSNPAPPSSPPKRKPPTTSTKIGGGGGSNTPTDDNNNDDTTTGPTPSSSSSGGSGEMTDPSTGQKVKEQGTSPGMIAVVVLVVLAVIAAVAFSCYRVHQAKRRRHQSFDEDILKNHVPSANINAAFVESGGYGLYHGNAAGVIGNKENDPWRKNLDVYHRE